MLLTQARGRLLVALTAVLLLVAVSAAPALADPPHRPDLEEAVDAVVDAGAAGVVARVDAQGKTSTFRAGVADVGTGRPVPWEARFMIASLTKPFVAAVLLQLVEEGQVGLDDPLGAWQPDVLPNFDTDAITVRNLLQMRSGIPDYLGRAGALPDGPRELGEMVALMEDATPLFEPGARYHYSNINYILLGLLIEEAGGQPFAQALQDRILDPLKLRHTLAPVFFTELPSPSAVAYLRTGDGSYTEATLYNPTVAATAGGMVSTTRDVNTFHRALLQGDVVGGELLAEMLDSIDGYGLGMMSDELSCGLTVYGHGGSITGFGSEVWSTVDGDRQMVLNVNTSWSGAMRPTARAAIDSYFCG